MWSSSRTTTFTTRSFIALGVDEQAWRAEVETERAWRNGLYLGPDTPLSPAARQAFKPLRWFPIDASWRIPRLKLARPAIAKPARLAATGEDAVEFLDAGLFTFSLQGIDCTLRAFEPAPGEADEPYLLIPYRDETSGKETYGAGRYLDLEPNAEDIYELDFNRAYHPYCAYDDAWVCTLPPRENHLRVRVTAGARL